MNEIALPILLPFSLIIILIFVRSTLYAKWIGIVGSALMLLVSVYLFNEVRLNNILVLQVGGWEAPYGISLVIDNLSSMMLVASNLIVFAISIYAYRFVSQHQKYSKFFFFFFALSLGVNGIFITGDAFNFYVWLEVLLLSSFVLITMGVKKGQLEGGIKYMSLNLISSLFFLAGLGLLYGKTGTLNMAHLADILIHGQQASIMNTSAMLFFIALGIKAAIFPLFFWLPASYHTANITVTSLFAGLLTKVGIYGFIRFTTLFFVHNANLWYELLLITAGSTMVVGGMAASVQYDTRRILSYHIISQIGYMIMGLGIYTPLAIAGAIYFTIHNMLAKTNTFLVAGIIYKLKGTFDLKNIGGLFKEQPFLALLFAIPALALAGIPPLSGFFGKLALVKAGIDDKSYLITAVAILTSLLTLYSMVKIWNEAFLKEQPENGHLHHEVKLRTSDMLPSIILGTSTIALGLLAGYFIELSLQAANQLLDPDVYINAVLKGVK